MMHKGSSATIRLSATKGWRLVRVLTTMAAMVWIADTALAQRPPVEAIVRDVNERYRTIYGDDFPWPSVPGKDPRGPLDGDNNYYSDSQWQTVIEDNVVPLLYDPAVGGLAYQFCSVDEPDNRPRSGIPSVAMTYPGPGTGSNPDASAAYVLETLCKMKRPLMGNCQWILGERRSDWNGFYPMRNVAEYGCGEAPGLYDAMLDEYLANDWVGFWIDQSPSSTCYICQADAPPMVSVGAIELARSRIKCDLSLSGNAKGIVYVCAKYYEDGGYGSEIVTPDDAWHPLVSVPGGSVSVNGPYGPDGAELSWGTTCGDWGWYLTGTRLVLTPEYTNESKRYMGKLGMSDCNDGCNSCASGQCSRAEGTSNLGISFQQSLGTSGNETDPTNLHYNSEFFQQGDPVSMVNVSLEPAPGVEVIRDSSIGGTPRQVLTGSQLTDITTGTSTIQISMYQYANRGTKSGSYYVPTGTPMKTVTITKPAEDQERVTIITTATGESENRTEFVRDASVPSLTVFSGWDGQQYLKREVIKNTWALPIRTETRTVYGAGNEILSCVVRKHQAFAWGDGVVEERVKTGPQTPDLVSTTEYYNDASEKNKYGRVKLRIDANWHWTKYDYDSLGRVIKKVEPFKNSKPSEPDNCSRVVVTSYEWVGDTLFRTEVEKIQGQEVSRRYLVHNFETMTHYQSTTAPSGGVNDEYLAGETKYITSGIHRGRPSYTVNTDGTLRLYDYAMYGADLVTTASEGQPDSGRTSVIDGYRTVTRTNPAGVVMDKRVYYFRTGDSPVELLTEHAQVVETDVYGRPTRTQYLDGTEESEAHRCCGSGGESSTDRFGVVTSYVFDALNRVKESSRLGIVTRTTYDALGRVLKSERVGADSSVIVQSVAGYNWAGEKVWEKDAVGRLTKFEESNPSGYFVKEFLTTYPDGSTERRVMYLDGQPMTVEGTAVHPEAWDYEVVGNQRCTKHIKGSTCLVGCPVQEHTVSVVDAAGREISLQYPDEAQTLSTYYSALAGQSPVGSIGKLRKAVDPDGVTKLFEYNGRGEQLVTAVDFDRDDVVDLAGMDDVRMAEQSAVGENGRVLRRSVSKEWQQNNVDAATEIAVSDAATTSLESWPRRYGLVTHTETTLAGEGAWTVRTTAPDGSYTIQTYENGRLSERSRYDSADVQIAGTSYAYDAHGRVRTETDVRNGATNFAYTSDDQIESVTKPAPESGGERPKESFVYDVRGRQIEKHRPDGSVTYSDYFPTGELKRKRGAGEYDQSYTYDDAGRMKTLIAGTGTTTWNYDAKRGWLTSKLYNDGKGPSYEYWPSGRMKKRTWARGIVTNYTYDNAGRPTGTYYPSSTVDDVVVLYDRRGLKKTLTDVLGMHDYSYYPDRTLMSDTVFGSIMSYQTGIGRDVLQRRNSFSMDTFSEYRATLEGYDNASRLNIVTDASTGVGAEYEYESSSSLITRIIHINCANAVCQTVAATDKAYDKHNRVKTIVTKNFAGETLASFEYEHNILGQRTEIRREDGASWNYGYDAKDQVVSGQKRLPNSEPLNGYDYGYAYDSIGNRTSASVNGETQTYTANALNQYTQRTVPGAVDVVGTADVNAAVTVNQQTATRQGVNFHKQLAESNTTSPVYDHVTVRAEQTGAATEVKEGDAFVPQTPEAFTYDDDGNLTQDGRWTYTWNGENRLIGMQSISTVPAAAKKKLAFVYDAQGRRVSKTVFDWIANGYETTGDTTVFYYDGWNLVAEGDIYGTITRSYLWGAECEDHVRLGEENHELLSIIGPSGSDFVLTDGNGSVIMHVDVGSGHVSGRREYGPSGEAVLVEGLRASQEFGFFCGFEDIETGMILYGLEVLNPRTGLAFSGASAEASNPIARGVKTAKNAVSTARKTMDKAKEGFEEVEAVSAGKTHEEAKKEAEDKKKGEDTESGSSGSGQESTPISPGERAKRICVGKSEGSGQNRCSCCKTECDRLEADPTKRKACVITCLGYDPDDLHVDDANPKPKPAPPKPTPAPKPRRAPRKR